MMERATPSSAPAETAGRRLSHLIWLVVLIIAAVALGTTMIPWTFSTAALRDEVTAQIRQATGLAALSQGRAVFAILPQPHIKIDRISFGDPSGMLQVDADYFKGNLRILPLFVGRLEIASATLLRPRLVIDLDGKPALEDSAIGRAAEAKPESAEAAAADAARLGVVSLVNGTALVKTKSTASAIVIDDIDVTLDWRNLNMPASLTGKARVRGEFGDVAAWVARPAELLRGGRSEMTLDVKTDILSLTANGILSASPKPEFSGHLRAASLALPKLLELIGYPIARAGALSRIRLSCEARANPDGMSLSNLNLRFAGSDFEGSLAIEPGESQPLLSGTLATDLLTLDPFFAHLRPLISDEGQWNQEPLDLRSITTADLDIRVSAARARLAHLEMQDAALSLMTHANRMDLSLAEAKAYRGIIKARATLAKGQDGIDLHAAGSMTDIDAGALSWDAAGLPEVTGLASGTANIDSVGRNLSEFIQHLDGKLQFSVKQGDVGGFDLNQLLHATGGSAVPQAANTLSVRTPYDLARFGIKIVDGAAEVEQGLADGPGGHLLLSGTSALSDRKLDLRVVVLPVIPDATANPVPDRNILIKGSWDHPLIGSSAP